MRLSSTALAFVTIAGFAALPAHAQYGQSAPPPTSAAPAGSTAGASTAPAMKPSKGALQAIYELQQAVNSGDTANLPARVAAAQAVAATDEDRYLIAALRLRAALAAKDDSAIASSIEALLASGKAAPAQIPQLRAALVNAYIGTKQLDKAAPLVEQMLAADPRNSNTVLLLAQLRQAQGRFADALAVLQKGIAAAPRGSKADEKLYRYSVQIAYDNNLPDVVQIARDWVRAYPSADSWQNALAVYRNRGSLDDAAKLDVLRLERAASALKGDSDHYALASTALQRGYPGEAQAVLDEAASARRIDPAKPLFAQLIGQVKAKVAGDRESLVGSAAKATTARQLMVVADAYYGYADYAEAAKLYRQALVKPGADPDLLNLRLGMALAQAGDKAAAVAALNAVGGARSELAKFWLTYVETKA